MIKLFPCGSCFPGKGREGTSTQNDQQSGANQERRKQNCNGQKPVPAHFDLGLFCRQLDRHIGMAAADGRFAGGLIEEYLQVVKFPEKALGIRHLEFLQFPGNILKFLFKDDQIFRFGFQLPDLSGNSRLIVLELSGKFIVLPV